MPSKRVSPESTRDSAIIASMDPDHVVQFYEKAEFLLDSTSRFLGTGLETGDSGVVIATEPHRQALEARLCSNGLDLTGARKEGRYVPLDASETLSKFMVAGRPDRKSFVQVVGSVISEASTKGRSSRVRAFGEMVALLWAEGNWDAAIALEQLWNDLRQTHPFSLFCAYPMEGFHAEAHGKPFVDICAQHSSVIPGESYMTLPASEERLRAVAQLQQKANSLETEIARRVEAEKELQKKLQELADADRRKDEFLAMLGHELRNPLSPIVTALQLMRLRSGDPETLARSVEVIERQAQRMTRLVDDLLDVSRITRGAIELRDETVELKTIVERAVEQVRPLLEERGHRLTLELAEEPLWLRADSARLEQVLANLLINAAKYTDFGGHICAATHRDGDQAVLSVRDNGVGLTPELRERAFELFVQSPDSATRVPGGLGVGLTLVRRLVQLHLGSVEARSDGPGRGSEFVVRLPLRAAPAPSPSFSDTRHLMRPGPSMSRRILVVDDNVDAANGMGDCLREMGHHVRTAQDGVSALEEAGRLRPEIVFLDIAMPGLDGHEVARRLRREIGLKSALLVAVTGYGQECDRQLSREAGFDHHLVKPVDIEKLEALLKIAD